MSIIYPKDLIIAGDGIMGQFSDIDQRLYNRLVKYLAEHTVNGKIIISKQDMAELEDIIYNEVKGTPGYEKRVNKYLDLFDQMEQAVSQEQVQVNQLRVQAIIDLWRRAGIREVLKDKVVYDLGRGGMKHVFVRAVADLVREQAYFTRDIGTAMNLLRTKLIDEKYTERYLQQTARDSLSQYSGAMQDQIRIAYDFDELLYAVPLIETSRPVCIHIVDVLGARISKKQLQDTLDEFCPDGVPSHVYTIGKRKVVDKQTGDVSFVEARVKKGSGMIEGTFLDNFSQLKGGRGCRHNPLWTRRKKTPPK